MWKMKRTRQPTLYIGTQIDINLATRIREEASKTGKSLRKIMEDAFRLYLRERGGGQGEDGGRLSYAEEE
jgi:hypothetical protein